MLNKLILITLILILGNTSALSQGLLTNNIRIESEVLGYTIQYRVYTPENMGESDALPTIYVTDGHEYIRYGRMVEIMDKLIKSGKMKPVVAIFVDPRDPDNLRINRRVDEYHCNQDYGKFYANELIKTIETNFPVSENRNDRVIQGTSSGGVNAACFGLYEYNSFAGLSMHSPSHTRIIGMLKKEYNKIERLPLKMFISVGNVSDSRITVRRFKSVLKAKGYEINYKQVNKNHDWDNWRPLIDDALLTFFAVR